MTPLVAVVTKILSLLTVLSDVFIILLIVWLLTKKFGKSPTFADRIVEFLGNHAIPFSMIIASASVLSSLFYSEIAGFAPCVLCWWQRIFLYPQVPLFGLALWKKDNNVASYGVLLSAIGGALASYHSYIQFGGSPLIPCSASGISVSCAQRYFLEFGYVTIPTMALTAFIAIILLMIVQSAKQTTS